MTRPLDGIPAPVLTATMLTTGLVGLLVVAAWAAPSDALPVAVVFTAALVAFVALMRARLVEPLIVALVVTGTFAVNTVVVGNPYTIPGSLGGWIWLVDTVLVATVVVAMARGWLAPQTLSPAGLLFGLFVTWTLLAATVGAPPRPDVAVHYSLYVLRGWLVFVVVSASVREGLVSLPTVAGAVAVAATGHAVVACAQAVAGGTLGLRAIAEGSTRQLGTLSLGGLPVSVGPYVSGFTAAGSLSGLAALGLPLVVVAALWTDHRSSRVIAGGAALVTALALRFTDWDSGRGALLLQLVTIVGYGLWRTDVISRDRPERVPYALAPLAGLATVGVALLYPSSTSGRPATTVDGAASAGVGVAVPFFDVSNLGIRLQQYAAGFRVAADNPLFGVGGANFSFVAVEYGLPDPLLMHNVFIGVLAETGVAGFALLFAVLVAVADAGYRLHGAGVHPPVVAAVLLACAGYLLVLSWQPQWLRISSFVPFWALCAALVGANERHRRREVS